MRPKLQKQSALKLAGRTIPQSGGYDTPQIAEKSASKACFGVHTRDWFAAGDHIVITCDYNKLFFNTCLQICQVLTDGVHSKNLN
jgi:hypothetical protein